MKTNYLLFGLLCGSIFGFFVAIFGIDSIIDAIQREIDFIIMLSLVLLLVIIIIFIFGERIVNRIFSVRGSSLVEIADMAAEQVKQLPILSRRQGEVAATTIKTTGALYSNWALRAAIFRAVVAIVVALGGVFGTYVLLKQNEILQGQSENLKIQTEAINIQTDLLSKQTDEASVQNSLLSLNLVSDFRERLRPTHALANLSGTDVVPIRGDFKSLALGGEGIPTFGETNSLMRSCVFRLRENGPELALRKNLSEVLAISELAKSSLIKEQVSAALGYLVNDEDSGVALAAIEALDRAGASARVDTPLKQVRLSSLALEQSWDLEITNSLINDFSCPTCNVDVSASIMTGQLEAGRGTVSNSIITNENFYADMTPEKLEALPRYGSSINGDWLQTLLSSSIEFQDSIFELAWIKGPNDSRTTIALEQDQIETLFSQYFLEPFETTELEYHLTVGDMKLLQKLVLVSLEYSDPLERWRNLTDSTRQGACGKLVAATVNNPFLGFASK